MEVGDLGCRQDEGCCAVRADFTTMSEAMKQGKAELKILLQKKFPSAA